MTGVPNTGLEARSTPGGSGVPEARRSVTQECRDTRSQCNGSGNCSTVRHRSRNRRGRGCRPGRCHRSRDPRDTCCYNIRLLSYSPRGCSCTLGASGICRASTGHCPGRRGCQARAGTASVLLALLAACRSGTSCRARRPRFRASWLVSGRRGPRREQCGGRSLCRGDGQYGQRPGNPS